MRRIQVFLLSVLLLVCAAAPVRAESNPVEGIDVSAYNGTVDWASVKAQGIKFVMIRTAVGKDSGTDDVDRQFEANYEGARAVGLKCGVYHVAWNPTVADAKKEADYCLKILKKRPLQYPVAYDIERPEFLAAGKTNVTNMAKAFCDKIRAAGYTPMIYASEYNLNTCFDWSRLKGVKVWVASYGVSEPSFNGAYHIWQYTSEGNITGAGNDDGECDLDRSWLAEGVSLNYTKRNLGVKKSFTLKAVLEPEGSRDTVVYTSSNAKVAKVSSKGVVTGVGKGTAVITAEAGMGKAVCKVTVKVPSRVTLPKKTVTLKRGKTYTIKPSTDVSCYKYTYKSSKPSVAAVSSKGKVTAKKKGTATITVKTFNGKTAKLTVKVI